MHLMNYHHSSSCISSKQTGTLPVASPTNCCKPCCYAAEYGVLQKDLHNKNTHAYAWALGTSKGNRTPDFALRGQRLNRLTMEAYGWGTRIRT